METPQAQDEQAQTLTETTVEEYVKVATLDELKVDGARKRTAVKERDVTLFRCGDDIFAIDSVCYHMGGPLDEGDIEDVHELKTGEGLYVDMKGNLASKGVKQRTHPVKIDGQDVYVLAKSPSLYKDKVTSDDYAYKGLWKIPKGNGPSKIHSQRNNLPPSKSVYLPK